MEKEQCAVCPRGHIRESSCTITTCTWPLLNIDRPRECQEYYPPIKRIKGVRFVQPSNAPWGHTPWTNLMYRPVISGGFKYLGVNKLVPLGPPPNSPVLCRPTPISKTDCPGMIVYCDSRFTQIDFRYFIQLPQLNNHYMDAIWNHMQLERPPNATCCIGRETFDTTGFLNTLDKIVRDLISQELLHKEAAILSRLIYRMKSKFRNDKGMKAMSKLNRALLNYLSLCLEKEYENLRNYVEFKGTYVKLPTKQMVEYVLVRTQGFAKLMVRIEEISKHAAHFLKSRIMLGHAWSVATIAYSVVSRIWMLSRHLTNRCCIWYNDLYHYLRSFKASGLSWLPTGFDLPSDLRTWLTLPWIDEPTPHVPSSHGIQNIMFKLITPCDYDSDEDLDLNKHNQSKEIKLKNPSLNQQKENAACNDTVIHIDNVDNDAGEIIDRRSFSLKQSRQTPIKVEKYKKIKLEEEIESNVIEESVETIPKYLKKEKRLTEELSFVNVKNKTELTFLLDKESYPGLDKLQWNMIRNKGKKQLKKLNASSNEADQSISIKKVIKRIQRWIN